MEFAVDGHRVFAATGGRDFDAGLPAVVFLHGAGMDHTCWQLQGRWFAYHGRSVLQVDLPDHGRSGGEALTSIADMAAWTGRLLDAAGLETAALVGHSMGALVALEAAAAMPGRITGLALLGVADGMAVHPDLLDAARRDDPLAWDLVTSWGHGRDAHVGGHPVPGLWMLGAARQVLAANRPGVLYAGLEACNAYHGASAAAARVRCPTLLLLGSDDLMTPPGKAKTLAGALADSRTEVLDACGHMMMTEAPDATLDALIAAL